MILQYSVIDNYLGGDIVIVLSICYVSHTTETKNHSFM